MTKKNCVFKIIYRGISIGDHLKFVLFIIATSDLRYLRIYTYK